ncbi:mechanosensitive ion channel family protein [Rhizobium tumorigenes]|uniref:Mechanosensitive ion channel family protein n=1 Tax=Rhizobium tumorigenes TaxID=2041385 RepID=A0AAF1KS74_9HYPH|nr:mechanosensitive ion channel family protein [Rhizobium tumorigenes]WFR97587.1 mechanosensitive ion channel family protein [Rhizobium tumorigenes]
MKWLMALLIAMYAGVATAQTPTQPKIDELVRLLNDPELRTWLANKAAVNAQPESAPAEASGLSAWELATRHRVDTIIAALPRIPTEVMAASRKTREDAISHGYAPVMLIFAVLVAVGSFAEWGFRWMRRRKSKNEPDTANAAVSELLPVFVFAAMMAIIFFAIEWPPIARIVLLTYLIAFVLYRCLSVLAGLSTDSRPRLRRRARLFLAAATTGVASATLADPLGVDPAVSEAISYCFSLALLAISIEAVWATLLKPRATKVALSLYLVGIWALWCLDLKGLFWIGVYSLTLPVLLRGVGRAAASTLSPSSDTSSTELRSVLLVRGSRAIIIGLAVAWIATVWHLNPDSLAHQNPKLTAILYGLAKSVVVLLIADLLWQLAKSQIDRTLATTVDTVGVPAAELARRGRLLTLLPIFRNVLAVFVGVMAALIVLSELGVEIAPLVAGAGIFGVALGFGSQTLVKDVISGVFYMLDDAFRVGEYIQAKSYMGTVEGFSLRSVRLRHHRGPVFTVPFGELGAVENMSRDWAIDKFKISVGYDTDINVARKIAKAIGTELLADPELGPQFITPLKMKGVESFGDYGIVLSFAMTTVPGQQTSIRRKAYAMIREAFRANGIEFATPSVQVGGEETGGAAAAANIVRAAEIKAQAAAGES